MNKELKNLKFKTNINCGGCVAKVTPFLNSTDEICSWHVDTANRDKILTVETKDMDEAGIIEKVKEAGFNITPLEEDGK